MKLHHENVSDEQELIDQVIAEYLRAEAVGQAGQREQWLDRYPTCAEGLAEFFDNRERIGQLVVPVRIDQLIDERKRIANGDGKPARFSAEVDTVDFNPAPPKLSNTRYRPLRFTPATRWAKSTSQNRANRATSGRQRTALRTRRAAGAFHDRSPNHRATGTPEHCPAA